MPLSFRPSLLCAVLLTIFVGRTSTLSAPFQAGEKLHFDAYWGLFAAAGFMLEVQNGPTLHGKACWAFKATIQSRGMVEKLYPIRSYVESRADRTSLHTVQFMEDRYEGPHRYHRLTDMRYAQDRAIWTNYISGHVKKVKLRGRGEVFDLFSSVFYCRMKKWKQGERVALPVFTDGAYQTIHFRAGRREKRQVGKWKKMKTLELISEDLFEEATNKKGTMRVFVTDDVRLIPLQARLQMSWGTVVMTLSKAEGILGKPLEPFLP